jgi:hypothetical protein
MADKLGTPVWEAVTANWTVTQCEALEAFAELLETIYVTVQSAIATGVRVVVRWAGAPELVAALVGEFAARAVTSHFLSPLKGVAQTLRVVGALACACGGQAGSCACMKVLAKRVLLESLKQEFVDALDRTHVQPTAGNAAWLGCVATFNYLRTPTIAGPPRIDPAGVRPGAPSLLARRLTEPVSPEPPQRPVPEIPEPVRPAPSPVVAQPFTRRPVEPPAPAYDDISPF